MKSFLLLVRRRLQEEAGFTLVELLITSVVLIVLVAGLSNVFVSGERATSDTQARLTAQQNVRSALQRLEYETRCASTATLQSGGSGVVLSIPSWCDHAQGSVAWCVTSGALVRIAGSACGVSGQTYISGVTSASPFSCNAPVGPLPQLEVSLAVDVGRSSDSFTDTDWITMRNATATTSSTAKCS